MMHCNRDRIERHANSDCSQSTVVKYSPLSTFVYSSAGGVCRRLVFGYFRVVAQPTGRCSPSGAWSLLPCVLALLADPIERRRVPRARAIGPRDAVADFALLPGDMAGAGRRPFPAVAVGLPTATACRRRRRAGGTVVASQADVRRPAVHRRGP